jgi:hypothetical protein
MHFQNEWWGWEMVDIFISYNRHDAPFAQRLSRELERFNVHGFMDAVDVAAGSDWSSQLREAIRKADAVLVILSASAVQSSWVLAEIGLADSLGKIVIPVTAPGENSSEAIPDLLVDRLAIDANRMDVEEVAARVVASATNIPVELARDQLRTNFRRRRLIYLIVGILFASMLIATSFIYMELQSIRYKTEHAANISSAFAVSPDGTVFATGLQQGETLLWDGKSGQLLRTLKGGIGTPSALAFSPDGRLLAVASRGGNVDIWDIAAGALVHQLQARPTEDDTSDIRISPVISIQFARDGREFYSRAGRDIRVWSIPDWQLVNKIEPPSNH